MNASQLDQLFSLPAGLPRFDHALKLLYQKLMPDHCFIAKIHHDKQSSRVLSYLKAGKPAEPFDYQLANTPCATTSSCEQFYCYYADVTKTFPLDTDLVNWQIASYLGFPLLSYDQKVVGILVCLFKQPLQQNNLDLIWLKKLVATLGSELNQYIKTQDYQQLVNQLQTGEKLGNIGSWRWNMANDEIIATKQVYRILELPLDAPLNYDTFKAVIHPKDKNLVAAHLYPILRNECQTYEIEHRIVVGNKIKTVRIVGKVDTDDNGEKWLHASVQDISQATELKQNLFLANIVFDNAADAILICDANNKIIKVNPALEQITGFSEEELLGQDPQLFSSGKHNAAFFEDMWQKLKKYDHWQGEIFNKRKNGEIFPEELSLNVVRNKNGEITNYIAVFRDISHWKNTEKKLQFYANNEPLTGLFNRRYFYRQIESQIAQCQRYNQECSIIMVNLDYFGEINNIYGQSVGDEILKLVAQRIQHSVRKEDSVCRYSGDEFSVLLANTQVNNTEIIAEKIHQQLTKPFTVQKRVLQVTASIGIAHFPNTGNTATELLRNAEYALHSVKSHGRNGIAFHNEQLQAQYQRKIDLREQLKLALKLNLLQVYYQPIAECQSEKITKFEALIRWPQADGSFISPAEFIPIAEEFDLINQVGQFVLETAVTDLKHLHDLGLTHISFSINRSICEFQQQQQNLQIQQLVEKAGLATNAIVIEITESVALSASRYSKEIITNLKQSGFKIALDDFCTGYSSLSYLIDYDADFIKIDKSFIDTLLTERHSFILVSTLIELANKLHMKVIAEGVESNLQSEQLKALGCHYIQGYYLSAAVPFNQAKKMLEQQSSSVTLSLSC